MILETRNASAGTARAFDVIVVGAGPAGSTLASCLGSRGVPTLLVDRATFPREKPCGDYLSPGTLSTFERLGVLDVVLALPHRRLFGHELYARTGEVARGRFVEVGPHRPPRPWGLAIRRALLDHALLKHAASYPSVTVMEGFRVDGLLPGGGVRGPGGEFHARLVAGCDGVASVVARELGLSRMDGKLKKVALVGYWRGMEAGDFGEVHFGDTSYVALAPVDRDTVNVNLVVDAQALKSAGGDVEAFHVAGVKRFPKLAGRMRGAALEGPVRATGPMARRNVGCVAPGAILVGDSAEFVDPVTGEGMFIAMRGAEMAAELVSEALATTTGLLHIPAWAAARHAEFASRMNSCWRFQSVLPYRRVVDAVVRRLATRPDLADLAVSVSGDYAPTSELFNAGTILSFLNPFARAAEVELQAEGSP